MTNHELTPAQKYSEDIISMLPSSLLVLDSHARVILANKSFYDTFKKTEEQTQGQPIEQFLPLPGLAERIREVHHQGRDFFGLECKLAQPGDLTRILSISAMIIRPTSQGTGPAEQDRVLLLVDDITERKYAEESLIRQTARAEESSRLKTEFLANMSHEIRTPMNGIIGFADLLAMEDLPPQQAEWVSIVRTCGQNLLELIDDILDISKIEADQLRIEPCQFGIADMLDDVMHTTAPAIEAKGLSFSLEVAKDTPQTMNSDPQRLRQIITNLLTNAMKFTDTGSITVRTKAEFLDQVPAVRFEVADTGTGIAPEHQEVIFEVFKQIDTSASRKYGGSGLGLAICKRLTHRLGGRIGVESRLGYGATFTVVLPLQIPSPRTTYPENGNHVDQAQSNELQAPEATSQTLSAPAGILQLNGHILLAEDNQVNSNLLKIILERVGLQVDLAANGREAVNLACSGQYDLILMDIQMPCLDGLEATRILRHKGITTPVIALTAHAMHYEQDKFRQAGCDGFLPKPVNQGRLLAIVQQYLRTVSPISSES